MTCPKCGLPAPADQKFCRSCGASLQMTTQPLAEPATISDLERMSSVTPGGDGQRRNSFVLWGLVLMFIGVAIGVVGKKLVHEDIITVVGVLISLLGMFLTTYQYLKPVNRQGNVFPPSSQPKVLNSPTAKGLPQASNVDYVPSITERTTDLLESSVAAGPAQKKTEVDGRANQEKGNHD